MAKLGIGHTILRIMFMSTRFAFLFGKLNHVRPSITIGMIVVGHAALWCLLTAFFVSSLHHDTLQPIAWAHEPWSWIYPKHPPLLTWIIKSILATGLPTISAIILLGQIFVAVSALYLFRTILLTHSELAASFGTLAFLCSTAANAGAVTVNHNTILMPILAALLFYLQRYIERARPRDIYAMAISFAFAILAKYQIILFLPLFLTLLAINNRLIFILRSRHLYLAIAILVVIIAPHFFSAMTVNSADLSYAIDKRPIRELPDVIQSLTLLVSGSLIAIASPFVFLTLARLFDGQFTSTRKMLVYSGIFGVVPVVSLLLGSLATWQIIREGWLAIYIVPFSYAAAILIQPTKRVFFTTWLPILSLIILLAHAGQFAAQFYLATQANKPIRHYDLDRTALKSLVAGQVDGSTIHDRPCVILADTPLSLTAAIDLAPNQIAARLDDVLTHSACPREKPILVIEFDDKAKPIPQDCILNVQVLTLSGQISPRIVGRIRATTLKPAFETEQACQLNRF